MAKDTYTDIERIHHIRDMMEMAIRTLKDVDFQAFEANEVLQLAVVKMLEIVGEASYWLSNDFKSLAEDLPWHKIAAFRHIAVHEYDNIRLEGVYRVVKDNLPANLAAIRLAYKKYL